MSTADSTRQTIRAAGAAALLAFALLGAPADAGAARVEVLSPGDGKRVYGKSVLVRVKAAGPKLRVTADGNDVTRRFRGKGAVRSARLRLGRDFSAGDVTIAAGTGPRTHGGRRTDATTVTVLRRRPAFAQLRTRRLSPTHPAPYIDARARKPLDAVRVWVNGKRVHGALTTRADLRGARGVVGAHTGLRYGRNRVVVELEHRSGVYDRERATFRIPRTAPLASAGEDLELHVGDPAELDGTATRFAGRGAQAAGDGQTMQWEIVQAPEGSSVQLEQPGSATPIFTPDVPGNYTVRLTATDATGSARDDQKITVSYSASDVGIPLISIGNSGEVLLGSTSIPGGQPYHMVVLDQDGGVIADGGSRYFGVGQEQKLRDAVKGVDPGFRVLLTGGGVDVRGRKGVNTDMLEQAIVAIGGTVRPASGYSTNYTPTPNGARDLADGHWTVFGRKGLVEGQAVQSTGVTQSSIPGYRGGEQGQRGSLNGYLQQVDLERLDSKSLEFVAPEAITLDTKYDCAAGAHTPCSSATHNVVQTGTRFHQSPPLAQGALGMHLLMFGSKGTPDGGASGLPIEVNETYVLNNPDGSTNAGGVEALAKRLDGLVNGRPSDPETKQPVLILQTFGAPPRPGTAPKSSPFWVNDQVPRSGDVRDWEDGAYPTAPMDLVRIWNPRKGSNGTPADYSTVAGLVGQLAGAAAHDMVANFGYGTATVPDVGSEEPKRSTSAYAPHHELGLTVVASPHASDPGAGYAKRQTDPLPPAKNEPRSPLDGSVVGTLRRNNQGQFRLTNPSLAASLPYRPGGTCTPSNCPAATEVGFGTGELWEVAFQAPTPFPCSAEQAAPCSSTAAAVAAMRHITTTVFPTTQVQDVRALYVADNSAFDGKETPQLQHKVEIVPYPDGDPGFTKADLDALKDLLANPDGELQQVANVRNGVQSWQDLYEQGRFTSFVNAQQITEQIVTVVLDDEEEARIEAEIDAQEAVSAGLLVVSELAEIAIVAAEAAQPELSPAIAAVPSVIGVVSASTDFATSVTPEDQSVAVAHDEEQIRARAADIGARINDRYTDIKDNLFKLNDIFISDAGKLAKASDNFTTGLKWTYGNDSEVMQARATTISTSRELYEGLMPLAFQLAVVSPHRTGDQVGRDGENTNGPLDDLRTYNCTHVVQDSSSDDWAGKGTLNPFDRDARSAFHTLHHRRQDGPNQGAYPREKGTGAQIGLALKGRKAKFNAQDIDDEYMGIANRGSDPPADLTDPLFRIPRANDGGKTVDSLRMSKDEFFSVDRWQTRKIQCGPS